MGSKASLDEAASHGGLSPVSVPSEADLQRLPESERLMQAAQATKGAASAQTLVDSLKSKAALITNPKEREQVLAEAYNREIQAHGLTKKAQILKSGTFQGATGGLGIGAATGLGLGTVVGTLVGTVASLPTTAVGGLVGAGVGAIHGPWIKPLGDKQKGEENKVVQVPEKAVDSGAVQVYEDTGQVTAENPEELMKDAAAADQAAKSSAQQTKEAPAGSEMPAAGIATKKKPRKIEVRSNKQAVAKIEPPALSDGKVRRKPPKLEVRSNKTKQAT